jgi:hypothetical protein
MKKLIITLLLIGILLLLYFCIGGFPIIFNDKTQILHFEKSDTKQFNPLENVDLSFGKNKVVLLFSFDDITELPNNVCRKKVLVCSDNEILQQLKNNFTFEISGGDMATIESEIIVFKDNKLVLKTNFVLDKNLIGIQNKKTGLAKATNKEELYKLFEKFKPYRKLFLVLE